MRSREGTEVVVGASMVSDWGLESLLVVAVPSESIGGAWGGRDREGARGGFPPVEIKLKDTKEGADKEGSPNPLPAPPPIPPPDDA